MWNWEYMWKDRDSSLLLEVWVVNMERNLLIQLKKYATDAIKTAFKRSIQKTVEATGDLLGNKIADKRTSVSKKSTKKLPTIDGDVELTSPKKRHISPEERQIMWLWGFIHTCKRNKNSHWSWS